MHGNRVATSFAIAMATLVMGCSQGTTGSPSVSLPATATPSPVVSPAGSASAQLSPLVATPGLSKPSSPGATAPLVEIVTQSAPVSPTGCELPRRAAQPWTSDRLRSVEVNGAVVEFRFDPPSSTFATPPTITYGPTRGNVPVAVDRSSVMAVRFEHLRAVFGGPRDLRPTGSPVKQVVVAEDADGVLTWLIALVYPGCSSVTLDPSLFVVRLDFGGPIA